MSKHLVLSLSLWCIPAAAAAQVGHDPAHSPYRDIRNRSNFAATALLIGGSGGRLDIGPRSGAGLGLRYEMRLTGPSDAFFETSLARFQRLVIDPDAPAAERVSGPIDQSVVFVHVGLSVLLTGDKTWRGLAPYLGGSFGMGFSSVPPSDSSDFRYNAKFVSGPHLGVRFYATRSLSFRLEGRLLFWQLKYPDRYFLEPARALGQPSVLDPEHDSESEWTSHPTLVLSIGYAVRL